METKMYSKLVSTTTVVTCLIFSEYLIASDQEIEKARAGYLSTLSRIKSIDATLFQSSFANRTKQEEPRQSEYTWLQSGNKYVSTWTITAPGHVIPSLRFKNISNGEHEWKFVYVKSREDPVYVLKRSASTELLHKSSKYSMVSCFLGRPFNVAGMKYDSIESAFTENSPHLLESPKGKSHLTGVNFSGFKSHSFKSGSNIEIDVWFDGTAGTMPRLFSFHNLTKNTQSSLRIEKFKKIETEDGTVWFPVSVLISGSALAGNHSRYQLKSLKINTQVPNGKFNPNIPSGVEIVDENNKRRVDYYNQLIRHINSQ